ncbi:MAG TPA: 50S ribosomal protein L3 N(5)-glutamine methyltransferase [Thiobacillus sp.]|nr:50S ribosomal protein L3 N(5)-glutamine methyltransferase [Thiobacillus sp.]
MKHFDDTESLITVRDWLRFAVSRFNESKLFFGHGSDNAFDEAAYLILHTLHLPLDRLEPFLDASLTHGESEEVQAVIERRVRERLPAAYLTHEAWLGEHRFYVDERVIVPRSFIAELLHGQLAPWIEKPDEVSSVLDLYSGSGCLAILAALAFPNSRIDAVDLSRDALAVATRNVADYELAGHITLIESDLFAALEGRTYDVILSNPPYVNAASVAALPPEYQAEPALGSGEDGLDATRQILAQAKAHLNPGGLLLVEIGHNRDVLKAAYPTLPFTWIDTENGDQFVFILRREDLPDRQAPISPPA